MPHERGHRLLSKAEPHGGFEADAPGELGLVLLLDKLDKNGRGFGAPGRARSGHHPALADQADRARPQVSASPTLRRCCFSKRSPTCGRRCRPARAWQLCAGPTASSITKELHRAGGFIKRDPDGATYYALKREEIERLVAPLSAERVLHRLERDGHLVTTARRSPWKQVLVKELDADKLPYACVRESFLTAHAS